MKVLFLQNVPKIGKKFEVKEVADGFAYNSLIPRKLAVPATKEHMRRAELEQSTALAKEEREKAALKEVVERTANEPLPLTASANEKGHLFKGVHASDIVSAIKTTFNLTIGEKDIVLKHPLKEAGTHTVEVVLSSYRGYITIRIN